MFLLAGNIMLGAEKLWGELLFPEEKWLFFSTKGRKNSFSKGNKCSPQSFFVPGIMFFNLKDTFSLGFILWPTINPESNKERVGFGPLLITVLFLALKKTGFSKKKKFSQKKNIFFYLFSMQLFSADATMFSKFFF